MPNLLAVPDALVPVLVLDPDDKEADKALATFDPLGAIAEPDKPVLEQLLKGIETDTHRCRHGDSSKGFTYWSA